MKKYFLRVGIVIILLIASILYLYSLIKPTSIKEITIATGRKSGIYYKYAKRYKESLELDGISVNIIETAGSIEILKLLRNKKVDFGFVQSGTASIRDKDKLKSVASLYIEPLWIFYRSSLGNIGYLDKLKTTPLSIGEEGSGTYALSSKILKETNIDIDSPNIFNIDLKSSYKAFKENRLDAFFTVLSLNSKEIKEILQDKSIRVLSLRRASAFLKYFPFLREHNIYEGSLDLKKNIPSSNIRLLATTATVITHNGVDNSLVRLMAIKMKEDASLNDYFPSIEYVEIPLHNASKKYLLNGESFLEKIFPYWIASNIDRLKYILIPLLTLLFPLFKSIVPLYRWRSRSKVYRWYRELDRITENWESFNMEELERVERELEELSSEIHSKTDVPLSFRWEYHTLQGHIESVKNRIRERIFNIMK